MPGPQNKNLKSVNLFVIDRELNEMPKMNPSSGQKQQSTTNGCIPLLIPLVLVVVLIILVLLGFVAWGRFAG